MKRVNEVVYVRNAVSKELWIRTRGMALIRQIPHEQWLTEALEEKIQKEQSEHAKSCSNAD